MSAVVFVYLSFHLINEGSILVIILSMLHSFSLLSTLSYRFNLANLILLVLCLQCFSYPAETQSILLCILISVLSGNPLLSLLVSVQVPYIVTRLTIALYAFPSDESTFLHRTIHLPSLSIIVMLP